MRVNLKKKHMSRATIRDGGAVEDTEVCILVPTGPNASSYYVLCADNSLPNLTQKIQGQLTNTAFKFPAGREPKDMLYALDAKPHVDGGNGKIYFNFPDAGNADLLAALRAIAVANSWKTEFASLPSLSSVVETLWKFLTNYGAHISLLMLVVGIAVMLMSSDDDPKSFIPKNTQKWLSTTSTAKKVVDVGSFWHRHFGEGRQDYNRPNYDDDRPDQPWQKFQDRVPQQMFRPNHFALPFNRPNDGFESLNFN